MQTMHCKYFVVGIGGQVIGADKQKLVAFALAVPGSRGKTHTCIRRCWRCTLHTAMPAWDGKSNSFSAKK